MITLDQGELKSIEVESLEKACDQPEAVKVFDTDFPGTNSGAEVKSCGLKDCSLDANATGRCDPKIYITWIGTDVDNHNLVSVNERLTNFNNYNIGAVYEDLIGNDTNMRDGDQVESYSLGNIKNSTARSRIVNPAVKTTSENTTNSDDTTETTNTNPDSTTDTGGTPSDNTSTNNSSDTADTNASGQ